MTTTTPHRPAKPKKTFDLSRPVNADSPSTFAVNPSLPSVARAGGGGGLEAAMAIAQGGGLLSSMAFTAEAAREAGRPLRKHKVSSLVVHPNNPRPVSAEEDLGGLTRDMLADGQKDPIHIVPFEGGWAIIEGQRRWKVAPLIGLDELDAFEHPAMAALDVYLYGRGIHNTRQDTSALDDAISWARLIESEKITARELVAKLNAMGEEITEAVLSKQLAITSAPRDLIDEVRRAPSKFSSKHLYVLYQFATHVSESRAVDEARRVRLAGDEKPVSALSLERLLEALRAAGGSTAQAARKKSESKIIRAPGGTERGVVRGYKDGRIDFKPMAPLDQESSAELHSVISRAVVEFFEVKERS